MIVYRRVNPRSSEEILRFDLEGPGDGDQMAHAKIPHPPFDSADVAAVDPREIRNSSWVNSRSSRSFWILVPNRLEILVEGRFGAGTRHLRIVAGCGLSTYG